MPDPFPIIPGAYTNNVLLNQVLYALMTSGGSGIVPGHYPDNVLLKGILYQLQHGAGGGGGGGGGGGAPSGIAGGDLGGTYPNPTVLSPAHLTGTLPALNGSNLTSLTLANISGTGTGFLTAAGIATNAANGIVVSNASNVISQNTSGNAATATTATTATTANAVALANITGAGAGVLTAGANAANAASGIVVSNGSNVISQSTSGNAATATTASTASAVALANITGAGTGFLAAGAIATNVAGGVITQPAIVNVADANATLSFTGPTIIIPTANLTAARTLTLPAASAVPANVPILFIDMTGMMYQTFGSGGSASSYAITRAGADTINGGTSVLWGPGLFNRLEIRSDGVSKWTLAYPGSISASLGGNAAFRPVFHAPNDVSTGLGIDTQSTNPPIRFVFSGNSSVQSASINAATQDGMSGRFFPITTGTATTSYPSGGYTGNYLGLQFINNPIVGWNYSGGDKYFRAICGGFAQLSFSAPTTPTSVGVGYFGDAITVGATFSLGVGKVPSIVGLDVAGAIQSDTSVTTTGSANIVCGGTLQVGGGTVLQKFLSATASLTFSALTMAESTQTITVTGAVAAQNPSVTLGWSAALPAGLLVKQAWVSADNTVSITVYNTTAGTLAPTLTCRATVEQF